MSATIGSTNWTATSVSAVSNSGFLVVAGVGAGNSTMGINMPSTATAGTDSVTSSQTTYSITYSDGSTSYAMSKGVLVISSNSGGTVSGTFSGKMDDFSGSASINITKGAFTAKY